MTSASGSSGPKPTLLAFHGSGTNATIHTVQLARLNRVLKPSFNVVNLDAPFPSNAGPGVLPFYDGCGPFKSWLNSSVTIEDIKMGDGTSEMPVEVEHVVKDAVARVRREGGRVVGVMGFSQGTKVVAGLLKGSEIRRALQEQGEDVEELDWLDFSFGFSNCGSYPPPLFPPSIMSALRSSSLPPSEQTKLRESKISVPVFHVQGTLDEWNWAGQALIEKWYEVAEGKSVVKSWEQGHNYPVKPEESEEIRDWMVGVLKSLEGDKGAEGETKMR
jgi:predicted esterase